MQSPVKERTHIPHDRAPPNGAGSVASRPHYVPVANEERIFKAAYRVELGVRT
jgi:hypothetical protein